MSQAICVRFLAYLCVPLIGFEVLIKKLCGAQCSNPKSRVCITTTVPSLASLFSCSSLPSSLAKRAPFWLAYHNLFLSTVIRMLRIESWLWLLLLPTLWQTANRTASSSLSNTTSLSSSPSLLLPLKQHEEHKQQIAKVKPQVQQQVGVAVACTTWEETTKQQ